MTGCSSALIDTVSDGPYPISFLFNGSNYQDFSYPWTYEYLYENADNVLSKYATITVTTTYSGSTFQCQETYQGVQGSWQGPWQ
jgi:hypothetical protein